MPGSTSSMNGLTTRLAFLSSTAHLLAHSAPPISAHLMRECDDLYFEHSLHTLHPKPKKAIKPMLSAKGSIGHCSACGTIAIPGRTCKIEVVRTGVRNGEEVPRSRERSKAKKGKRTAWTPKKPKALKRTCLACHRSKMEVLQRATSLIDETLIGKGKGLEKLVGGEARGESMSTSTTVVKPSANAGSKARAKARKNSGLQQMLMLAKMKPPETRDVGSLMDWMDGGS